MAGDQVPRIGPGQRRLHRLADVARLPASAFPKYDRNLNIGGPLATGTEMIVATNSVWHTQEHPSHLILAPRSRPEPDAGQELPARAGAMTDNGERIRGARKGRYGLPMLAQRGELRESAREHRDMLEAICRQDADAVTAVATHHLEHTRGIWAGNAETAGQ
jgi:hypothetical protein